MILTGLYVYVYNFILTYQLLELVQIQASFETFFLFFFFFKFENSYKCRFLFITNNNYKLIILLYMKILKIFIFIFLGLISRIKKRGFCIDPKERGRERTKCWEQNNIVGI